MLADIDNRMVKQRTLGATVGSDEIVTRRISTTRGTSEISNFKIYQ